MRVDQFLTTVTVDNLPLGIWDAVDGGNRTAGVNLYHPGGMAQPISLGGRASTETVTVSRLITRNSGDWNELVRLHQGRVGKAVASVTQRPLDEDGNPYGDALVYRGRLSGVNPPSTNSNEDGEALWSLTIEPEG